MALSTELGDRAKRFRIYKNGDIRYIGKEFVLNRRRIRNWDSFLQQVTNDTRSIDAVRSIRTPVGGTKIGKLEELQDKCNYVAVGTGKFKKIGYLNIEATTPRKHVFHSPRNTFEVKPVEHSRIQVSGRIRKIPTDVITVFVFANGKPLEPAKRVTLTRGMMRSWEIILQQLTERINLTSGAVRRLCSLEGVTVTDPATMKSGGYYVAVGADIGGFRKLDYGSQRPAFNISPKQPRRKLDPLVNPPHRRGPKARTGSDQTGSTNMDNSMGSTDSSDKSQKTTYVSNMQKRQQQPRPPKKREEDSVFHAKPVKHKRTSVDKQQEVDYDKDEGGIFKAKERNKESDGAQEVEETRDTQVDLPIDQVEAEEVKDEEIEEEDNPRRKSPERGPPVNTTPPPRTPTPPQRTPTPKERTPTPKERTPTPKERTPTPPQQSPTPRQKTPTPVPRSPTPENTVRSPTPPPKSPEDGKRSATPRASSRPWVRSRTPEVDEQNSPSGDQKDEEAAATKIQSNYRGYRTRQEVKSQKDSNKKVDKEKTQEDDQKNNDDETRNGQSSPHAEQDQSGEATQVDSTDNNQSEDPKQSDDNPAENDRTSTPIIEDIDQSNPKEGETAQSDHANEDDTPVIEEIDQSEPTKEEETPIIEEVDQSEPKKVEETPIIEEVDLSEPTKDENTAGSGSPAPNINSGESQSHEQTQEKSTPGE